MHSLDKPFASFQLGDHAAESELRPHSGDSVDLDTVGRAFDLEALTEKLVRILVSCLGTWTAGSLLWEQGS